MKYYEAFKAHKIPGVALNICNAEQKIAYNLLFSHAVGRAKNTALDLIQSYLIREQNGTMKKYDIDLIYHYVLQSIERYQAHNKSGILTSYAEIGSVINSSIYTS